MIATIKARQLTELIMLKMRTYFIPKQLREPRLNGTRLLDMRGLVSPSQRSGTNSKGLSKIVESVCIRYADMPTGT